MTIARHTLPLLSIVGCSVDVLGSLYLAYDLLGGEHGPLRTLTRAVTYGALFGIGFGVFLGPVFALVTGITQGITLGWEFSRASRGKLKSGFWYEAAMSGIRGLGFGLGAAYLYGPKFGITFGALTAVGQTIAYQFGMRPTMEYEPSLRLRVTKFQVLGVLNRTVRYAVSGYRNLPGAFLRNTFASILARSVRTAHWRSAYKAAREVSPGSSQRDKALVASRAVATIGLAASFVSSQCALGCADLRFAHL